MIGKDRDQRYSLTQARRLLSCDAKTLREWTELLGIVPVRDSKDKRKWSISAADLVALRKHHADRAVIKGPGARSPVQDETIRMLIERVTVLENELAFYKPALERYQRLYGGAQREAPSVSMEVPSYGRQTRPVRDPIAPQTDDPPIDLPAGTMMARRFAQDHGVNRTTLESQVDSYNRRHDLYLYTDRQQLVGDRLNHWMTPEQQALIIAIWRDRGQKMHECERPGCPCQSDQSER